MLLKKHTEQKTSVILHGHAGSCVIIVVHLANSCAVLMYALRSCCEEHQHHPHNHLNTLEFTVDAY